MSYCCLSASWSISRWFRMSVRSRNVAGGARGTACRQGVGRDLSASGSTTMTIPRPSSRTLNIFPKRQARRSMLPSDGSAITKTSPAFVPRKAAKYSCSRLGVVCFVSFVYEARAMAAILVDELRKDRAIAWRVATEKTKAGLASSLAAASCRPMHAGTDVLPPMLGLNSGSTNRCKEDRTDMACQPAPRIVAFMRRNRSRQLLLGWPFADSQQWHHLPQRVKSAP